MTPDALTRTLQDFLTEASGAMVLEDGSVAFDLAHAKYSVSGEYNKCLLHLWSNERNTVRRVLDAEVKNGTLKLFVQRLVQSRPTKLEIGRERDRRVTHGDDGAAAAGVAAVGAGRRAARGAADHRDTGAAVRLGPRLDATEKACPQDQQ